MTKRYCLECDVIFEYEPVEPANICCPACGTPWTGPEKMSLAEQKAAQLKPWQIIALGQTSGDLASIETERRTNVGTRSAGVDTGPGQEKVPEVRAQLENMEITIGRLTEVVNQLTTRFRPVLAEVGGEKASAEEAIRHSTLAPLAEDIAALEERVIAEIKQLEILARRCEV